MLSRPRVLLVVSLIIAGLVAGGCGGSSDGASKTTTTAARGSGTTTASGSATTAAGANKRPAGCESISNLAIIGLGLPGASVANKKAAIAEILSLLKKSPDDVPADIKDALSVTEDYFGKLGKAVADATTKADYEKKAGSVDDGAEKKAAKKANEWFQANCT